MTGFFGIAAIIAAAAAALVSAGGVAFGLAFTEEDIWQPLTKLLYCNVGDDMSFSSSQWQAVGIGVNAEFTGIAKKHLSNLLLMLGNVGLTNVARTAHGVYDDTLCACPTCDYEIEAGVLVSDNDCVIVVQSVPIPDLPTYQYVKVVGRAGKCWTFITPTVFDPPVVHGNYGFGCDNIFYDPIVTGQCVREASIQALQYQPPFTVELDLRNMC